jgi:hypothetical protein
MIVLKEFRHALVLYLLLYSILFAQLSVIAMTSKCDLQLPSNRYSAARPRSFQLIHLSIVYVWSPFHGPTLSERSHPPVYPVSAPMISIFKDLLVDSC